MASEHDTRIGGGDGKPDGAPDEVATATEVSEPAPFIEPGHTYSSVTEKISAIVLDPTPNTGWIIGFGISFLLMMVLFASVAWLLIKGIGVWGLNIPVGWAF